ncbi:MAG: hypothetical protein ACJ73S_24110 [Mycobacteriales bacterium]
MSPRRHRRRRDEPRTSGAGPAGERVEPWRDGDWVVREVTGASSTKVYRCPGCDHEIRPATPHVVAWPVDGEALEDRRHWHRPCWNARNRRAPRLQRGRNSPRYG